MEYVQRESDGKRKESNGEKGDDKSFRNGVPVFMVENN